MNKINKELLKTILKRLIAEKYYLQTNNNFNIQKLITISTQDKYIEIDQLINLIEFYLLTNK